ncbi:MAG: imidazoleglycerol-phosphate dehydratase HisB [Spirochaetia bacterium]|nr:imidazoleglycerol-phosphate dehydratase HisB [Spirochaetia bacterium]
MDKTIKLKRVTKETDIALELNLAEKGKVEINTPVPFFNHMLTAMAFHGGFSLKIDADGDVAVDAHHLVEDIGLVLGDAMCQYKEKFSPLHRFGFSVIPMDDALSEAVIDVSGRPYMVLNADFPQPYSGTFDMSLLREFFIAMANKAQITLHLNCRYGMNSHHMAEALFKACGKAMGQAYSPADGGQVLSTKGLL